MKKLLITLFIILTATVAFAQTDSMDDVALLAYSDLKPEPQHRRVSQLVTTLLQRNHYLKKPVNDDMSLEIFDRYLEKLDYYRMYFLASDVAGFEKYTDMFDEIVRSGQVNAAFEIYNAYQIRAGERLQYIFKRIDQPFDYSIDEYWEFDRHDSPWVNTTAELDELWRKRIKNQALALKLAGKDDEGIRSTLHKRYQRLQKNIEQTQSEDVFQLLMNAFSESYDPHTNYFSPKNYDDFKIRMSQSLEGIGARLMTEDEYTKIIEIIPGGPADKSKSLHPNDKIVGVGQGYDGEIVDVIGWRIDDVVQLIRGKKSTVVQLQFIPHDAAPTAAPDTLALVRDKIKLEDQSAKSEILEITRDGQQVVYGVINIPTFYSDYDAMRRGEKDYKSTSRDVQRLIEDFTSQNIDGIIIDLRGNGGGFLNEAVDLTGLFIDRGPVVQVSYSDGRKEIEQDSQAGVVYDGPLAVVVDRFSASASEIFAAAIQDYQRGIIIGSQSYGKGTVQRPIDLNRFVRDPDLKLGQLKLTIAKFYRVDGRSTQHAGITPDITFPSRYNFSEFGESAQDNALVWDEIERVGYSKTEDLSSMLPTLQQQHALRLSTDSEISVLLNEINNFKKQGNEKRISLNEVIRRAEKKKMKANDDEEVALEAAGDDKKEKKKDLELVESANVLTDYIMMKKTPDTAKREQ